MEKNNNINIEEILKDCPEGTNLYSPLYGEGKLKEVDSNLIHPIRITTNKGEEISFNSEGRYSADYPDAECMLFPSSEMRDWTKFFKRGDVVRSIDDGAQAVFKGWESDDYTSFYASIVHHAEVDEWDEDVVFAVESFYKEPEEFARGFIVDAEKHYNGKYNPDTLQIEPVKVKCPFKPFDKVLVRNENKQEWLPGFFCKLDGDCNHPYHIMNLHHLTDFAYKQCIPYEGNEHLLGTTGPYKEGGSK